MDHLLNFLFLSLDFSSILAAGCDGFSGIRFDALQEVADDVFQDKGRKWICVEGWGWICTRLGPGLLLVEGCCPEGIRKSLGEYFCYYLEKKAKINRKLICSALLNLF